MDLSIIQYYGGHSDRCGYCKNIKCNSLHGMHAYTMSVIDYQDLIDRGWRRSGQYCYKPENSTTCCPSYTIKCNALEFQLSKSHKKILKRMNRFLRDGKRDKGDETEQSDEKPVNNADSAIREEPQIPDKPLQELDLEQIANAHAKAESVNELNVANTPDTKKSVDKPAPNSNAASSTLSVDSNKSADSNPPCKKAKQIRLERRQAKLAAKGIVEPEDKTKTQTTAGEKSLSDFLAETSESDKHKLKIVLVPAKTQQNITMYQLYRKYQIAIHNDSPSRITPAQMYRFLYKTPLELTLLNSCSPEFKKTIAHSYALYRKYQILIHNDPPENVDDYLSFCRASPLKYSKPNDGPEMGYGSFHQQYWLDDKLIAVGVIDVLPYCVSSVYFFYDPDYSFLSLGTYGSLREIDLVQRLAMQIPDLKYYYMGFYIHSCPKMRYKGKLLPSFLLCPETYTWQLLTDEIRNKLDVCKYQRFNCDDVAAGDANDFNPSTDLNDVKLLVDNNRIVSYGRYIQSFNIGSLDKMLDIIKSRIYKEISGDEADRERIIEYGKLVGKICAHRMLYLLDE